MNQRGQAPEADPRVHYFLWVTCASCGDVRVPGEDATLFARTLAYRCPGCGWRDTVSVPPSEHQRLVARGFPVTRLVAPAELDEPRPLSPPLALDDILDAHELLAGTDDIVGLLSP